MTCSATFRETEFVLSTKVGRLLRPYGRVPPPRPTPRQGGIFAGELPFLPTFDFSYDATMRSFEDSLQRLGMNRVDLLLIHDCDEWSQGAGYEDALRMVEQGALKALERLKAEGVISAFGAGVNQAEACERLMDIGSFDCFMLAGRYTLLEQGALDTFLPRCVAEGVSVILAAPFNSGILVTGAVPDARYNYLPAPAEVMEHVARIEAICQVHDVPLAAAALQFVLAHPAVVTVIPGGRSRAEVEQNAIWAGLEFPTSFWQELKSEGLLRPTHQCRTPDPGSRRIRQLGLGAGLLTGESSAAAGSNLHRGQERIEEPAVEDLCAELFDVGSRPEVVQSTADECEHLGEVAVVVSAVNMCWMAVDDDRLPLLLAHGPAMGRPPHAASMRAIRSEEVGLRDTRGRGR